MPPDAPLAFALAPAAGLHLRGADGLELLQRLGSGDVRPLAQPQRHAHTLLLTPQGKLLHWCQVLGDAEGLLLLTAPGRGAQLQAYFEPYIILEDVQLQPIDAAWQLATVDGHGAAAALDLAAPPPPGTTVAAAGGTWWADLPAFGPRLCGLLPPAAAAALPPRLLAAGAAPQAAAAAHARRLRAGVPSPEHEFAAPISPMELRLQQSELQAIAWNKGCYIGQEVISRLDNYDKVARLLIGIDAESATPVPDNAWQIADVDGRPLGRLTSWHQPDDGSAGFGLGIVKRQAAVPQPVALQHGDARLPARLALRPFFGGD